VSVGKTGDTAAAGGDYTAVTDFDVTIPAGTSSGTASFSLDPTDDAIDELDETLTVHGTATGLTVGDTEITITDDDQAELWVPNVSLAEGGKAAFAVRLNPVSDRTVTVNYATAADTTQNATPATAGTDYTAVTGTLTFAAGESTKTIEVQTLQDTAVESTETFLVTLSAPTGGATLGAGTGIGTITDDDIDTRRRLNLPTVSFGKASYTANEDDSILAIDLVLSEAQTTKVSVKLQLNSGTADAVLTDDENRATADALWGGYNITFDPGETSQTVSLSIVDNNEVEPDESFTVSLVLTEGQANLGDPTTVTITDDDIAWLSFEAPGGARTTLGNVTEGSGVALVIRLSKPHKQDVAVNVAVSGAAIPGTDYTDIPRLITFPAGQQIQRITIDSLVDQVKEQREDVVLTLSTTAKGVRTNESSKYVLWISDPDPNRPLTAVTLSSNVATVAENVSSSPTVTVTATLGGSDTFDEDITVTVSVGLVGDTAVSGTDYAAVEDFNVIIAAGDTSGTADFTLDPTDDTLDEPDEILTLYGTGVDLRVSSTEITITDDDSPALSVADATATEGGKVAFTVSLSSALTQAVTVQWVTADDSSQGANQATADTDYTAVTTAQTLTIPAGGTTATIEVQTTQDILPEPAETFLVTLSSPTNATLADATAIGTIADDDPALPTKSPTVGFAKTSYTTNEDDGILNLKIVLSKAQTTRVKVKLQLQSGTAETVNGSDSNRATADAHTWGGSSTVFEPGETSRTVSLSIVDNNQIEPDETFTVSLVVVEGQANAGSGATVTITDDDRAWLWFETPGGVRTTEETVTEGSGVSFVVRMNRPHKQDVRLLLTPSGEAISGVDYTGPVVFTIPAGEQRHVLHLDALPDDIAEGEEDLVCTLSTDGKYAGLKMSRLPRITFHIFDPS